MAVQRSEAGMRRAFQPGVNYFTVFFEALGLLYRARQNLLSLSAGAGKDRCAGRGPAIMH